MTVDSSAAALAAEPTSSHPELRKYRSRSCPAGVESFPVTVTVCVPSPKPDGSLLIHASAPWETGGNVEQLLVNSVAVTPNTFCAPVASPAAGGAGPRGPPVA